MWIFTDRPERDYDNYIRDLQRRIERHPKCICCGENIPHDHAFRIGDDLVCEDCIDEYLIENCMEHLDDD